MGTIKILGFDEDGNAQRLKIRIARFLDYDPVTASDKSNIRSTLGITSQGGLGDLLAANNLDDVASLDTTKANLEIPDVGTAPNEVPLNGQLGSLAYQSADSVSVDTLEVTDKVDGSLGIDVTPTASKLEVSGTTNSSLMMTRTSSGIVSNLEDAAGYGSMLLYQAGGSAKVSIQGNGDSYFTGGNVGIGTASPDFALDVAGDIGVDYKIYHNGDHDTFLAFTGNTFTVRTGGTDRLTVNNSAIQMGTGMGIDFGSGASTTLDSYEEGSWTPVFAPQTGSFTTMTMNVPNARYTKIGNMVHIRAYIRTDAVNSTGASGTLRISGLPFTATGVYSSINVGYALDFTNNPAGAYVQSGNSYLVLNKRSTSITGSLAEAVVGDLNSSAGTRNYVMIDGAYETTA